MEAENRSDQQQSSDSNLQGEVEMKPLLNLKCPRCDSEETKFCYYNNYKTSQPRYVCRNCNRFWTQGGNVRKNPSRGGESGMKRARDSSSSSATTRNPSTTFSSLVPPLTIASADGNVHGAGTLNFTRPRPEANQRPLKFYRVDINSLSLTKSFIWVLDPYMNFPQARGQSHPVQRNGQFYPATYGQGFASHLKPSNHGASHYMEPSNENIFWNNSNQIGLYDSSSRAWPAHFPGYSPEP